MRWFEKIAVILTALAIVFLPMEPATFKTIAGIIAGLVSFIAHPLYIWAILRKETIPHIFTWSSSALLVGMELFFYSIDGGVDTIYVLVGDFVGFTAITILSVFYGKNKHFYVSDWLCLAGALISMGVFILFRNAFWAFIAALTAEMLALIPTATKAYRQPDSEDFIAWTFTCAGNLLNLFAMGWTKNAEIAYVLTILLIDGIVWIFIFRGKK